MPRSTRLASALLALAATLSVASAATCSGTVRPVVIDMNMGGGSESVLTRLEVNYVEITTDDGSAVYVMKDGNLQTMNALYDEYPEEASDILNPDDGVSPVEQIKYSAVKAGQIVPDPGFIMPPFPADVVSLFFKYVIKETAVPGMDHTIESSLKVTPFTSAKAELAADGTTCKMMVSLNDVDDVEDELVSIDGVSFDCLKEAYDNVPDAFVALDAYTALTRTTGAVPARGDSVKVVLKNSAGTETSYEISPTFAAYTALKNKLDERNGHAANGHVQVKCGGMNYNRYNGEVNAEKAAAEMPTCARVGVYRRMNDDRAKAFSSMVDNKIGFAMFKSVTNLQTGAPFTQWMPMPADPVDYASDDGGFVIKGGLYDKDGNPTCDDLEISVAHAEGHCSLEAISEVVDDLTAKIASADSGEALSAEDLVVYTGRDAWVECNSIFASASTLTEYEVKLTTDKCALNLPEGAGDWWDLCESGKWANSYDDSYDDESVDGKKKLRKRFRRLLEDQEYESAYNPDDPYCKDPCCNLELQNSMCCEPSERTFTATKAEFDTNAYMKKCIESDAKAKLVQGVLTSDVPTPSVAESLNLMNYIFNKGADPKPCLETTKNVNTKINAIKADLECCLSAVVGEWSNADFRFKSKQPCNGAADCYSGSCAITTQDTSPSDSAACFPEGSSFTNTCNVATSDVAGKALADCILGKLEARGTFKKEIAAMRQLLGGSPTATNAAVGAAIIERGSWQTCEGPDGWKYDVNNWCQNYDFETGTCGEQFCETTEECKNLCTSATACNWKPYYWDPETFEHRPTTEAECLDASLTSSFCAVATEWGDIEDVTTQGYCRTVVGVVKEESWWETESDSITDALCQGLDANLDAVSSPWDWTGKQKRCVFTSGTMSSDQSQCLSECVGNDGFKPPVLYACYKDTSADGDCASTGWFNALYDDPRINHDGWNWEINFPKVCLANDMAIWGPGGIMDQAVDADPDGNAWSGSSEADAIWTVELTTQNPDVDGTYVIKDSSAWQTDVLGHSDWWKGLVFTDETIASAVCTELGASVLTIDDGSQACYENRCWMKTVTSQTACEGLTTSTANHGWFEWKPSYNDGSGACMARWHHSDDYEKMEPYYSGKNAVALQKAYCSAMSATYGGATYTGTFYLGRSFDEGTMDSSTKCAGQYCNVAGPRTSLTEAQCDAIGGKCQNTDGCVGCRSPWWGEITDFEPKEGFCYKSGVTSEGDCSDDYVSALNICVDAEATEKSSCESTWVTCDDLAASTCSHASDAATSTATSASEYASMTLKCRKEKQSKHCKTKTQCEDGSGRCYGPALWSEICSMDEDTYTWSCRVVDGACKVSVDPENPHVCPGSPECDNGWGCWDEERHHFGDYCVDYTYASQSACEAANGEWIGTDIESQKTFCLSDTECEGGRSVMGTHERDQTECEKCGGTMRSWGEWNDGTWVTPAMITGGREWKTREMTTVNTWATRIDTWRVKDLVWDIENLLTSEAQSDYARCMYGEIGEGLKIMSAYCGGATASQFASLTESDITNSKSSVFANTSGSVGRSAETDPKISTDKDSMESTASAGEKSTLGASTVPEKPVSGGTVRRRASRRRSLLATPSLDDAECWSKVRNSAGHLVGQLLGDCTKISKSADITMKTGVELCLPTSATRGVASEYTVDAFAVKSADGKYTSSSKTVTRVGTKLCALVTEENTYFCPAKLATTHATATSDIGSDVCAFVEDAKAIQLATENSLAQPSGTDENVDIGALKADAEEKRADADAKKIIADEKTAVVEQKKTELLSGLSGDALKKATLLADAAIAGVKVSKIAMPLTAASPAEACETAFAKMSVEATNGICEAATSSRRRNLLQTAYYVTVTVSPAVVDVSAVTASLTTNGITATMTSVDPVDELALIDGIDLTELDTFNTAAEEAAAANAAYVLAEAEAKEAEQRYAVAAEMEDEDGLIKGLDEASGIAVLTAAALACCCGTSCVGWCWFRRRRDNYAAGKANTVSAANNNRALPAAQP